MMKRNLILVLAVIVALVLAINSYRKITDFRLAAKTVDERQAYLDELKKKNEEFQKELEYKESSQFAELEIRNKLGLAKPGEAVVIVPRGVDRESEIVNRGKVSRIGRSGKSFCSECRIAKFSQFC